MPEILEPRTKDILRAYVRDVKSANNESAKRARFAAVIAELFPGTNAVSQYTQGVEKLIRIEQPTGTKKGHADAPHHPVNRCRATRRCVDDSGWKSSWLHVRIVAFERGHWKTALAES